MTSAGWWQGRLLHSPGSVSKKASRTALPGPIVGCCPGFHGPSLAADAWCIIFCCVQPACPLLPVCTDMALRLRVGHSPTWLLRSPAGRKCVLGLATGSTPMHVYRELVRMHRWVLLSHAVALHCRSGTTVGNAARAATQLEQG